MAAFWPGGAALWLWAVAGSLIPVALIVLATARGGEGLGPLRLPVALLGMVLLGSLVLLLVLPRGGSGGPAVFGLPLGTAWILFVLVPVPMALMVWAFLAFDRFWLRDEDLERLRQLGRRSSHIDGEP